MREFNRGLTKEKALAGVANFLSTEYGKIIRDDPKYQVSIRENYINVYYCGCSLLKYHPLSEKYMIHNKYLGGVADSYVSLTKGQNDLFFTHNGQSKSFLDHVLANPHEIVQKYIRGEKEHLANYIKTERPSLLDLEIAFTRQRDVTGLKNSKRARVANRIDMAVISEDHNLQFIEVKIDTDSRLRSEEDGNQEVLKQVSYYKDFLSKENSAIKSTYKTIAQNYGSLGLCKKIFSSGCANPEQKLKEFTDNITIDPEPYILVINTKRGMIGRYGIDHGKRLSNQLLSKNFNDYLKWDAPGK